MTGDPLSVAPRTLSVLESALFGAAPPVTLGRFEVVRQIGRGGMGVVYLACDPSLKRDVAVKVHLRGTDETSDRRLQREAESLARLQHRNIVTVHEVGRSDVDEVFIVMEYVGGPTLRQWVVQTRPSLQEVLRVFARCARGLHAAHCAGLVHRDFKPDNVLIGEDEEPVIIDFGLARAHVGTAVPTLEAIPDDGVATQDGEVLGTPRYMSPELWQGGSPSPAADQFALCASLFEMLSGGPMLGRPPRAPALPPPEIPRRVWAVVRRGLEADPVRRWPSSEAFARALAGVHPDVGSRVTAGRLLAAAVGIGIVTAAVLVGGAADPSTTNDVVSANDGIVLGTTPKPTACPIGVNLLEGPWEWDFDGPAEIVDGVLHLGLPEADFAYKTARLMSGPMTFQDVAIQIDIRAFPTRADHHEFALNLLNSENEGTASLLIFGEGMSYPLVANPADVHDRLDLDAIRSLRIQIEDRDVFADIVTFQVSEDRVTWRTLVREEANVSAGQITVQIGSRKPVTKADKAVIESVHCVPLDPPQHVPADRDFVIPEPD